MKVLLIKDVYKLGRAGDVRKVADGYGRNFLLPQGLAVLATPGALKQVDRIRAQAEVRRAAQNEELKGLAEEIAGIVLTFTAKAGDTGKMYGSITTQNVAEALQEKTRYEIKRHQIDMQPIRNLGEFTANVRLTMDLVPEIKVIVYGEGGPVEESTSTEAPAKGKPTRAKKAKVEETPAAEIETAEEKAPTMEIAAAEEGTSGEETIPEADKEGGAETA
jgi:large subunit ribosomal protein L9